MYPAAAQIGIYSANMIFKPVAQHLLELDDRRGGGAVTFDDFDQTFEIFEELDMGGLVFAADWALVLLHDAFLVFEVRLDILAEESQHLDQLFLRRPGQAG